MKKGEAAALSVKWWHVSKPKTLTSAGKLEQALRVYEDLQFKLKADGGEETLVRADKALDEVEAAIKLVLGEARKAKADPEMVFTVQAFEKLDIDKERKANKALAAEDDEPPLADPETYRAMLRKWLRRLSDQSMNFAFVVGRTAGDHRLVFHPSHGGRTIGASAAEAVNSHSFTYGHAAATDERPETILLALEAKQLPGLAKKGERLLKLMKPQPFSRIAIFVDGKEVEDIPDPTDIDDEADRGSQPQPQQGAAAMKASMQALGDRLKLSLQKAPDRRGKLMTAISAFNDALGRGDTELAGRLLKGVTAEVDRIIAAPSETRAATFDYEKLISEWNVAREGVATGLRNLEAAILQEFKGDSRQDFMKVAVRKLDQILAPMTGELQQEVARATTVPMEQRPDIHARAREIITRYRSYIDTDAFITRIDANPYLKVDIRPRLTAALEAINKTLPV